MTEAERSVNTQRKDQDPRKTAFAVGLMLAHKDAVRIYQDFGLMDRVSLDDAGAVLKDRAWGHSVRTTSNGGGERRKHFAPEHMVTVIAGCRVLGEQLRERGRLTAEEVFIVEKAAAVHDAGKELEFNIVNEALRNEVTAEGLAGVLGAKTIKVLDKPAFLKLVIEASPRIMKNESKGSRGQVAYDLAGDINWLRLKEAGVSDEVLHIQKMVGHASCPDTEALADAYENMNETERSRALQVLVMHYVDDVTTNPNVVDPIITVDSKGNRENALDRRCLQNENNPKYGDYNRSWKTDPRNKTGETAFAMQRRVGHKVEAILAKEMGVEDPLTLPAVIDAAIKAKIAAMGPGK